jgi:predicted hexulose-6-phosphate isomerase
MAKPYRLGLYEKGMPGNLGFPQKLAEARNAGFDYLELSVDETDEKLARLDWSAAEVNALRRAIEEAGVPVYSICLSGHRRFPLGDPDAAQRERSLAIMEKACVLAAALGVRIIQIAGYDVYYAPSTEITRRYFAENLARSVEFAARTGVMLAFETMETPFINTVAKAMHWVRLIDSPWLGVYPDIGNITNAAISEGGNPAADLESGRGRIAALHLKETIPGVFRELPYGSGHVDFASACAKARELGIGLFVGEFWHKGEENWRGVLADNAAFLRGHLDRAFALGELGRGR